MTDKQLPISTNDMTAQQTVDQMSLTQPASIKEDGKIWTPAFILLFTILFGLGMSIASLLCYIWSNSQLYSVDKIGRAYLIVLLGVWLILIVRARSGGIRLGAAFGGIWALGMFGQFWLNSHGISPQDALMTEMRTASNSALLGSALCLSTGRTRLRRWDTIFLWLLPLLFCSYLAYSYLKAPGNVRSVLFIEGKIASLTIYLTIAVWWLRLGSWRGQMGPTFLFGLAALLALAADQVGNINTELSLFILQLFFLCLILGAVRIIQGERHPQQSDKT